MNPDTEQARRYRHRAVEIRLAADMTRDRDSKKILRGVAEDWDRMAKTMEAIAQTDAAMARLNLTVQKAEKEIAIAEKWAAS